MNLTHLLDRHRTERGDKAALIEAERTVTYAELYDQVTRMAGFLESRGLRRGSRVLVFVPMSVDLYVILLGILHLGAVAVFVEQAMGRKQLEAALELAHPDAFIAVPKAHWLRFVSPQLRRVPLKLRVGGNRLESLLRDQPIDRPACELDDEAPALLTFTSGSTGRPKGAMRSHGFLLHQHEALAGVLGTTETDVELVSLPIFLLNSLAAGATAVIPSIGARVADVDAARLAAHFVDHRVTTGTGSPALFRPLVAYCREKRITFTGVRAMFVGGAPVPPGLLAELQPLLPNGDTVVVYGSTEAEPIAHMDGRKVLAETAAATARGEGLCVGEPVDCVRVRLEDDEILVAGGHVNKTYYENEDAVRRFKVTDADGTIWHRTGDAGRFDDLGRLWLLGRYENVVERGGRRIYPFAVELAARGRPGVDQAALIDVDGRVVLAVEGSGDQQDLVALDPAIDEVRVVGRIPTDKRHNAKVDYIALRKLLG